MKVTFAANKVYAQWNHPDKHDTTDTIAYHINIMYRSDVPIQGPVKKLNGNNSCILYVVCVKEETLAGTGAPACVNTSGNISGNSYT